MTRLRIAPTVPAISSVCGMKRIDTFGRVALVDYILIHEKLRFSEIGLRRDTRIDFAPIPCCGRKGGIDSLLARINSLLVCVGNLLANYWIRRCFRDGFSQKPVESPKFPAFFSAARECITSEDRESIRDEPLKEPTVRGTRHVRKTRNIFAAAGIQEATTLQGSPAPRRFRRLAGLRPSILSSRA